MRVELIMPDLSILTARQREVLDCITAHMRHCKRPPTIREMQKELDIKSPNGVPASVHAKGNDCMKVEGLEILPAPNGFRVLFASGLNLEVLVREVKEDDHAG